MRDYLLVAIVACLLPVALRRPYVGILAWAWLGLMNPHRSTWGLAQTLHLSVALAIPTLIGAAREFHLHRLPRERETFLLIVLWCMFTLTTFFSIYPDLAWPEWEQITKVLLMTFVTAFLVDTRERLRWFIYVVAFSVGFYGIAGGIFAVATAGQYRVWGPEYSFIADNNALALALNMTLPLFFYLAQDAGRRSVKLVFLGSFLLTIVAIVFTYSRGGLVGLCAVLGLLLLKSKARYWVPVAIVLALAAPVVWVNLPEHWTGRMATIQTYEEDQSAMSRINAWRLAWRIAVDHPLLGGGFEVMEDKHLYDRYYPESPTRGDVHSAYFEVMSEHGFVTFGVFVLLMATPLLSLRKIRRLAKTVPGLAWTVSYCNMVEVAIPAYLVSGAFLELSTFDYVYTLLAISMIVKNLIRSESMEVSLYASHQEGQEPRYLPQPNRLR
ncbi:MAG: putative O-glycosylation ligase, exosortase A system-associated [Deferrisomatales bacterium]